MLVIANSNPLTQYCPQQDHDGVWSKGIKHLPTRAFWPYHHFEAAAEEYRLGNHPEQ